MSDKTFERCLTGLTVLVVLWIFLGILTHVMPWGWVVLIGLVVEFDVGGYLLHRWGKSYMDRVRG